MLLFPIHLDTNYHVIGVNAGRVWFNLFGIVIESIFFEEK